MTKVLKFGGTSVGSAANMRKVADVIAQEGATITVLSAMSGTTDALVRITALAEKNDLAGVKEQIDFLCDKYTGCITELLNEPQAALDRMEQAWATIISEATSFKPYTSERVIISQGELLTSTIFTLFLQQGGREAVYLHAPDFMVTDQQNMVNTALLDERLGQLVADRNKTYITQGFICSNSVGEVDNLGRGGSDYSAAMMGASIGANQVQIWTDIDGMHNNDPRYVEHTYPIRSMSFDEAAELAYFGAKILHPATIVPCKEKGIPVLLKNTMDPTASGTTISDKNDNPQMFHAVAAKDGITVIRIYSTRMLMAYGFLRKVFEVFENHRTPIDMITTSEVSVSLTVDNDTHIEEIVTELQTLGTIEIERDNSIVCIVGCMDHTDAGVAARVFSGLGTVPIKMISYGASHRSITMLIDSKYKKQALQHLNDNLF